MQGARHSVYVPNGHTERRLVGKDWQLKSMPLEVNDNGVERWK
jgi:hypothetical protein